MALDGIVISSLVKEFNETLTGGKIAKIAQPENDELLLTIKNFRNQYRLLISAGASLPLIYLTGDNKPSPMTAPNFCMLLRKHIANGKILRIWPGHHPEQIRRLRRACGRHSESPFFHGLQGKNRFREKEQPGCHL